MSKYCPKCRYITRVTNSRWEGRGYVIRRRECTKCGFRYTTYEIRTLTKEINKSVANIAKDFFFSSCKTKFTVSEIAALKSLTKFGTRVLNMYMRGKIGKED